MAGNHSRSFTRFIARCNELYTNLQLVDVAIRKITSELSHAQVGNSTIIDTLGYSAKIYNKLKKPIAEYSAIVSVARSKQSEYAICQVYGYFTHYLRDILGELYPYKSYLISQLTGESISKQQLTFKEIIDLRDYDNISNEIVDRVFRSLENKRDTKGLIRKIIDSFGIEVEEGTLEKALCYFELRHLLVHNNGCADQKYIDSFAVYYDSPLEIGRHIPTNHALYKSAQYAIHTLCRIIDNHLVQIINEQQVDD